MTEHSSEFVDETRKWFETSLNEHGYGFQQTLLKVTQDLYSNSKSTWIFQVSELPVEVQGRGTRIDFILQRAKTQYGSMQETERQTILMIAECKRANPAYSNWCFAKSRYSFRGQSGGGDFLLFESLNKIANVNSSGGQSATNELYGAVSDRKMIYQPYENTYHVGVAVKGGANTKGNRVSGDPGKDAIEGAASQVCQGLNGLVNFLTLKKNLWEERAPAILIPVIFTTANLWGSDADLSSAELETGDLKFENHGFKQIPWLFFQYNLSPGIKHNIPATPPRGNSLRDILQAECIRTIPIVSPDGVEDFLRYASALDFTN